MKAMARLVRRQLHEASLERQSKAAAEVAAAAAAQRCPLSSSASSPAPQAGFMARAAAAGAQALLGAFVSSGARYDRTLEGLTVLSVQPSRVVCELTVREAHSNSYGTLHGGCTATLVDIGGTMAALSAGATLPAATGVGPAYSERCVDSGSALLPGRPPAWGCGARTAAGCAESAPAAEDAPL
jgi:hypothetical protein